MDEVRHHGVCALHISSRGVPCRLSGSPLKRTLRTNCTARTALLSRRLGKTAFGVLNFATPNSRAHEETARDVLKAIGLPLAPVVLHRYEAHKLASLRGLTAQEIDPGSNAATEIEGLWNWLGAELHLGTFALVHKGAA
jgi:chromosome partitioning protein